MAEDKARGLSPHDFDRLLAERLGTSGGGKNRDSWEHSQKTVTADGIAEQLPALAIPDGFNLVVRALPGNSDNIYLGKSKADAENADERLTYSKGNGLSLGVSNANLVWVDAAVSGEGVDYWVEQ